MTSAWLGSVVTIDPGALATPHVEGFEASGLVTDDDLRSFLVSTVPASHLATVTAIRYVDEYRPTLLGDDPLEAVLVKGLFIASAYQRDIDTGVKVIEVYRQSPGGSSDVEQVKAAVIHEVGYSLYENIPRVRHAWASFKVSGELDGGPLSESFCRTYVDFCMNPAKLRRRSAKVYRFIKQL